MWAFNGFLPFYRFLSTYENDWSVLFFAQLCCRGLPKLPGFGMEPRTCMWLEGDVVICRGHIPEVRAGKR